MKYYHGGIGGKKKGEFILPPSITKAKCSSDYIPKDNPHKRDKVYIVTGSMYAAMYAASVKNGAIYQVEPIGDLVPDPDYLGDGEVSYECEKARIVKRIPVSKKNLAEIAHQLMYEHCA